MSEEKGKVKRELVLWGTHPAHGGIPLKLEHYSKSAKRRREGEGWTGAVYAAGDEPEGLKKAGVR